MNQFWRLFFFRGDRVTRLGLSGKSSNRSISIHFAFDASINKGSRKRVHSEANEPRNRTATAKTSRRAIDYDADRTDLQLPSWPARSHARGPIDHAAVVPADRCHPLSPLSVFSGANEAARTQNRKTPGVLAVDGESRTIISSRQVSPFSRSTNRLSSTL